MPLASLPTWIDVALSVLRWLLVAVAAFWTLGTIVVETKLPHWPVRMWDFPRIQIMVFALLTGLLYLPLAFLGGFTWIDWAVLAAMLLVAARQFRWIVPYLAVAPREMLRSERATPRLQIIISNVLMQNEKHDLWRDVMQPHVEGTDVFACAELDQGWADAIDGVLGDSHPHKQIIPQDNMYGLGLWSRLPLEDVQVEHFVQDDIPSIHATVRLEGRPEAAVRLQVLHPRPPAPQENDSSSPRDAELMYVGRMIEERRDRGQRMPTVVMGDLNDVAWSRTTRLFRKISGLLDPRRGRGLYSTFHAEHWWFRFPLDHIFVSNEFRLAEMERLAYVGSDHFPMRVALTLEPDHAEAQPEEEPDEDELDEAEDHMEEQRRREREGIENGHISEKPDPERGEES